MTPQVIELAAGTRASFHPGDNTLQSKKSAGGSYGTNIVRKIILRLCSKEPRTIDPYVTQKVAHLAPGQRRCRIF